MAKKFDLLSPVRAALIFVSMVAYGQTHTTNAIYFVTLAIFLKNVRCWLIRENGEVEIKLVLP